MMINAETLTGTVLGTCTLQKLVGQGGMGAVYLAQQSHPLRQVAVKVLLPKYSQGPGERTSFLERFRRETQVIDSLHHPNIMSMYECGEREGLYYLVMPYINGGTLDTVIAGGEQLPLKRAMLYLEQMAAALDYAHRRGVIHRDIKPSNILMQRNGHLLLTDFGLVKILSVGGNANSLLTGTDVPLGTPTYMSPELVIGGNIDTRVDLYSLAIVVYQMVTGKVPFKGTTSMQIAMQHLHTQPPLPRLFRPDLPAAAEQVIIKALAKLPAHRYPGVLEFSAAFRQALVDSDIMLTDSRLQSVTLPSVLQTSGHLRAVTPPKISQTSAHMQAARGLPEMPQSPSPVINRRDEEVHPSRNFLANKAALKASKQSFRNDIVEKTRLTLPSMDHLFPPPVSLVSPSVEKQVSQQKERNTPTPSASPLPGRWPDVSPVADEWNMPTPGFSPLPDSRQNAGHVTDEHNTPVSNFSLLPDGRQNLVRILEEESVVVSPPSWIGPVLAMAAQESITQPSLILPPAKKKAAAPGRKRIFLFLVALIVLIVLLTTGVFLYLTVANHQNGAFVQGGGAQGLSLTRTQNKGAVPPNHVDPGSTAGSGNPGSSPGSMDQSFQVGGHAVVIIKGHASNVNVYAGSVNMVIVHVSKHGSASVPDPHTAKVQYQQSSDAQGHDLINITTDPLLGNVDYTVTAPNTVQVQVVVDSGSVVVNGISGVTLDTHGGNLDIENVQGPVNAHTENGDITAHLLRGTTALAAGSGSVRINDIQGQLNAITRNGDVMVKGATLSGQSLLKTTNGSVSFTGTLDQQGSYTMETNSGNVNLTLPDTTAFSLMAHTVSGSIHNGFGYNTVGSEPRAQVTVNIGSGSLTVTKAS